MSSVDATTIVAVAQGKRLHQLCTLPDWDASWRLAAVWSPDPTERASAAARYRVPVSTLLGRGSLDPARDVILASVVSGELLDAARAGAEVVLVPPLATEDRVALAALAALGSGRVSSLLLEPDGDARVAPTCGPGTARERVPRAREALATSPLADVGPRIATALAVADDLTDRTTRRDGPSVRSWSVHRTATTARLRVEARGLAADILVGEVSLEALQLRVDTGAGISFRMFTADAPAFLLRGLGAARLEPDRSRRFASRLLAWTATVGALEAGALPPTPFATDPQTMRQADRLPGDLS